MKGVFALLLLLIVVACTPPVSEPAAQPQPSSSQQVQTQVTIEPAVENEEDSVAQESEVEESPEAEEESTTTADADLPVWMTIPLKNIQDGTTFTIAEKLDRPILLESFAVWCPTCTRQQQEVRFYHDLVGDAIVSISLDTDPNEDEDRVREHIERHGFYWYYAVSPVELTQALIDDFGIGIVNAPRVPFILICPDGSYRQLQGGVKPVSVLEEEVATCG